MEKRIPQVGDLVRLPYRDVTTDELGAYEGTVAGIIGGAIKIKWADMSGGDPILVSTFREIGGEILAPEGRTK